MDRDEQVAPDAVRPPGGECTIGIDVGTTAVKAVAVDADGTVVARARVPHRVIAPVPDVLEHDALRAWRQGPRRALAAVAGALDGPAAGVVTSAMVPSMTAVDRRGIPRLPGLLYGDIRARDDGPDGPVARPHDHGGEREEGRRMLAWAVAEQPGAAGYWPCQAVATHALCGVPAVDSATASSFGSLMRGSRWDRDVLAAIGVDEGQLARVVPLGRPAGTVPGTPTVVGGGSIDAFCEQIVSGAVHVGDVLAIFGATLVVWVVTDEWVEVTGLTSFPSTVPERFMVGGPSNAGALFVDWVRTVTGGAPATGRRSRAAAPGAGGRDGDPGRVPVWLPYLRGERTPFHDPGLQASLLGLDIAHGPDAVVRASYEASGFVIRRIVERSGGKALRVVATGGGSRSVAWMQAVADATGLPVDTVAVPEGAALGAAFLARMTAGLEADFQASARWARPGTRIEPDPAWATQASNRFRRFEEEGPAG
ncbi:MAG: FGGY-family carbohydrate kinase [Acidimicrobiales bacterium]|jgi:xylulokinase